MVKKKSSISILSVFLMLIIIIQFLDLTKFVNAIDDDTLEDEDDLDFEILSQMNVTQTEMSGGYDLEAGEYTVQDSGTYDRWYKEPDITNGDFELDDLKLSFDDINSPYYDESDEVSFNKTDFSQNNTKTVNSSLISEYSIAVNKISQIKVQTEYNYTYSENNITEIGIGNGLTFKDDIEKDKDYGLKEINDTDNDYISYHSEYDYASRYNISDTNFRMGSLDPSANDLDDLQDDSLLTSIKINSEKEPDRDISGLDRYNGYEYSGSWDSGGRHHYDYTTNDHSLHYVTKSDNSEYQYFGFYDSDGADRYLKGYVYYSMEDIDADLSKYYGGRIKVLFQYRWDANEKLDYKYDTDGYCTWDIYDAHYGEYREFGKTHTGSHGDWGERVYYIYMDESELYRYIVHSDINFMITMKCEGESNANTGDLEVTVRIDEVELLLYGKNYIDADLEVETIINVGRVDFMSSSPYSYTVRTPPSTTAHFSGSGVYDAWFDTLDENPLDKINIYGVNRYSFYVNVYYVGAYDHHEFQTLNRTFMCNFTGQNAINNEYNVSLRYKASNSGVFELNFGNPGLDQEFKLLDTLDSTDWTTETFSFQSVEVPIIQIWLKEFSYDFVDQSYLSLDLDEIHINANYFPFANLSIINFNYTHSIDSYIENFTLGFNRIFNLTQNGGILEYIFTSEQFSMYDVNDPKIFVIPEQKITLLYEFGFNMSINCSFSIFTSSVTWIASTVAGLEVNNNDVIPTSPYAGYCEFVEYPDELSITTETEAIRFKLKAVANFHFESEFEITSRRVLSCTFKLISDHKIYLNKFNFDQDLVIASAWMEGIQYSVYNNSITPYKSMRPREEFSIQLYLAEDVYKKLDTLASNIGAGIYRVNLYGTTNTVFYDDVTKSNDFFIQLPKGFQLDNMDLGFSEMNYLPDYTTDPTNNTYDYGYYSPDFEGESVEYQNSYIQDALNATKLGESGNSGYESIFSDYFNSLNGYMSHNYGDLDGANSTYSVDDYLYMENLFPTYLKFDDWVSWVHTYNSDYTSSDYYPEFHTLAETYDLDASNNYPHGIAYVNGYFYVVDYETGTIYQYDTSFSLVDTHDIGALGLNDNAYGIEYVNNYFYITDTADGMVYQYSSDLNTLVDTHDIGALGLNDNPYGIKYLDNHFYICDYDEHIYKYNLDLDTLEDSYDLNLGLYHIREIESVNGFFYITDMYYGVYKYSLDFSQLTSFDLTTFGLGSYITGIEFVDDNFYIVENTVDKVYKFNASTLINSTLNSGNISDIPSQPSDFTFVNGTIDTTGDLGFIDNSYSVLNSTKSEEYNYSQSYTDVADGSLPSYYTEYSYSGCDSQVIANYDGRTKVLHMDDNVATAGTTYNTKVWTDNPRLNQTAYGTLSFWVQRDSDYDVDMFFFDIDDNTVMRLRWNYGNFYLYGEDGGVYTANPASGGWYFFEIHFDSTDNGYMGVEQNHFDLYINGEYKLTNEMYSASNYNITWYRFETRALHTVEIWFDDIQVVSYNETNTLNLTSKIHLTEEYWENIGNIALNYSYCADSNISFYIRNFDTTNWELINNSYNNETFYSFILPLNSSYFNSSQDCLIMFYGCNYTTDFQFFIEMLNISYNYTKIFGEIYAEITKDIDFSFLNRYDTYKYLKLYNITVQFIYKFINGSTYEDLSFANFTMNVTTYNLTLDGNWHSFNQSFVFDSIYADEFSILFNITNGLLEIKNLNYSIRFDCLTKYPKVIEEAPVWDFGTSSVSSYGMHYDGADYYSLLTNQTVVRFDYSYAITNQYDLSGRVYEMIDIYNDGSNWFVVGYDELTSGFILVYDSSFNYLYNYSIVDTYLIASIWKVGSNWYGYDFANKEIRVYDNSFVYTSTHYDVEIDSNQYVLNIYYNNERWYLCDLDSSEIYLFDKDFNYLYSLTECDPLIGDIMYYSSADDFFYCFLAYGSGVSTYDYIGNVSLENYRTEIYQYFRYQKDLEWDIPEELDWLQINRGNFILNFTVEFNASSDIELYNFWNTFNNSLFMYRLTLIAVDGGQARYMYDSYSTNNTFSKSEFSINITEILNNNGWKELRYIYLDFYLSGNPSSMLLDNITLWDFDNDFYVVNSCWIDDSVVISHQNISISWLASDRYIQNVLINQTFEGVSQNIFNITLLNNTLQSQMFWNGSTGWYNITLKFCDQYDNWELWGLNYTIISGIAISTTYQNPVFINTNNTITANIISQFPIINVFYDNSTDYLLEYDNSSYPLYNYQFNFTILKTQFSIYNFSIKVIGQFNDTFCVNVSYIYAIERTTQLDIINLKNSYEQDDNLEVTISLRDLYNIPIVNKIINYTIEAPNTTITVNSSDITDSNGEIALDFDLNIYWIEGWYHLNISFNDSEAQQYMGCYKMMSFEVTPIIREIDNASLVNLTVNNLFVENNSFTISDINATSFRFIVNHTGYLTFDLILENITLRYITELSYSQYIDFEFEVDTYSGQFNYVTVTDFNLSRVPDNITYYYFNHLQKTTYTHDKYLDVIYPLDPIGQTYNNLDGFSVQLRYLLNSAKRIQLNGNPKSTDTSIRFQQFLYTDKDYKFWYVEVTDAEVVQLEKLTHLRTEQVITDIVNEGNTKFKFAMSEKTEVNDAFECILVLKPDFVVNYDVITNNGTYSKIEIDYKADVPLENVSLILDLEDEGLYNENWTLNASQDNDFELVIPGITFTTEYQTITIEGVSLTPTIEIDEFESDQNWNQIVEDIELDYAGFLDFPKFSKEYNIFVDGSWSTYAVYYGYKTYSVHHLSTHLVSVEGDGFDPEVKDSFLHFKAYPFDTVDWDWNKQTSVITITIESNIVVQKCYFKYRFDPAGAHELKVKESDVEIEELSDSGDHDGYLYFKIQELEPGLTVIKIKVNFATPEEVLIQMLLPVIIAGTVIGIWLYFKYNEDKLEVLKERVEKFADKFRDEDDKYKALNIYEDKEGNIIVKTKKKDGKD